MTEERAGYFTNATWDVEVLSDDAPDATPARRLDCAEARIELLERGLRATCKRLARAEGDIKRIIEQVEQLKWAIDAIDGQEENGIG